MKMLKKIIVLIALCFFVGCSNSSNEDIKIFTFESVEGGSFQCYNFDYSSQIIGSIEYDQNMTIQENDLLYVNLVEVSHGDSSMVTILNSTCISATDENPISFSINYVANEVESDFDYFLVIYYFREIESGLYERIYTSSEPNYVLTNGYGTEINTYLTEVSENNSD